MTVKTAGSSFSEELDDLELEGYASQGATLARALEEARASRDACLQIKNETFAELERFRAAMIPELKARKQKFDLEDGLMAGGLALASIGIAVAFHWSYSLIVIGLALSSISVFPFLRRPLKTG